MRITVLSDLLVFVGMKGDNEHKTLKSAMELVNSVLASVIIRGLLEKSQNLASQ